MYKDIPKNILKVDKTLGYIYFIDSNHPLNSNGKVYYHRHIMSIHSNRWITTEEHVHHIDNNKLNNDISNLEIISNSTHCKVHKRKYEEYKSNCINCSIELITNEGINQKFCSQLCKNTYYIKDTSISREILQKLIDQKVTWVDMGKMFGYSDSGIRKRAKSLGCIIPKRKN